MTLAQHPIKPDLLSSRRMPVGLRGADLPLLISLNVLLEEGSVTRAANRLHVSQPALSAQLARLRSLFDDPLLVPAESGRGLVPTPFALKLHRRLRPALAVLSAAIRPDAEEFVPEVAVRTFHIAASNTAAAMVLPQLAAQIHRIGNPQLRIVSAEPDDATLAGLLEKGDIDLCFSAACLLPPGLQSEELVTTPYVLAQRKGHPRGNWPVTVDEYCALEHINVARDSSLHGFLDEQLYRLGQARRTVMAVRDYSSVGAIVAASDLVCTVPAFLAPGLHPGVQCSKLVFPVSTYTLCSAWHPAREDDPGVQWLRECAAMLMSAEPVLPAPQPDYAI